MASITLAARPGEPPQLRPLSIFRDLPLVADLIELCFSSTLDNDGRRYVQEMRRAGSDNSFMHWASRAAESTSLPLTGYVWEENDRIVGNTSLVPFRHRGQRIYLIANVAVHPDFRRRGIARALTERAVNHAREKKADSIWLQVRTDNPAATGLYASLGFVERARRITWQAATEVSVPASKGGISITGRHPRFWPSQNKWLSRLYPDLLAWHRNWNLNSLRPGFWNWLYRFLLDMNVRQWAAVRGNSLEAALAWIPFGRGESLFAATGPHSDPQALTMLLLHARHELFHLHPNLVMEYPAGECEEAILAAGFRPLRVLIWMQATL